MDVWKYRHLESGTVPTLQQISASVENGSLITLVGPSGAGKSTLLWLLNRLEDPDRGEIRLRGRSIKEIDVLGLRREVGLVLQQPVMLPGTVKDNILYGPRLKGAGEREVDAAQLLSDVGLSPSLLDRDAGKLSGGQRQRVALARTLANRPRVLLLDEVTSSLDPQSTARIENLIIRLNREKNITVLWVTHNLKQALRVGREAWILVDGKLVEAGTLPGVFLHPQNALAGAYISGKLEGVEEH
ncbi:MAG: phosphate ABC transporter ATP-binding protein [Peptococcaceae bacterium]|nr:phosphate ABC transporter ATP-binding protein [Peptococcaceae bacterium]